MCARKRTQAHASARKRTPAHASARQRTPAHIRTNAHARECTLTHYAQAHNTLDIITNTHAQPLHFRLSRPPFLLFPPAPLSPPSRLQRLRLEPELDWQIVAVDARLQALDVTAH
eukprot:6177686-Pleurochrysis_carterae.AAC.1